MEDMRVSYSCPLERDIKKIDSLPLAMAYVPWQQFTRTYDPNRALRAGTIFPELDKPFTGNCTWNNGGRRR